MGRLTADPDYRQTQQGIPVCKFSIAVDRGYTSKNSGQKETDFINITAWRSTADFVSRYFNKGKPIIVEGSLRNDNYTDKNGIQRYEMHVDASNVYFTISESRNNANAGGYNNNSYNNGNNYGNQGNYGGYQQGNYGGYPQGNYGSNGSYGGNYNQNQGNNDYYQAQPQQAPMAPPPVYQQPANNAPVAPSNTGNTSNVESTAPDVQVGKLADFEEILNDGEVPF
jgi:single-strand DNA-binding protein